MSLRLGAPRCGAFFQRRDLFLVRVCLLHLYKGAINSRRSRPGPGKHSHDSIRSGDDKLSTRRQPGPRAHASSSGDSSQSRLSALGRAIREPSATRSRITYCRVSSAAPKTPATRGECTREVSLSSQLLAQANERALAYPACPVSIRYLMQPPRHSTRRPRQPSAATSASASASASSAASTASASARPPRAPGRRPRPQPTTRVGSGAGARVASGPGRARHSVGSR